MEEKVDYKPARASSITKNEDNIKFQVTDGVQKSEVNVEEGEIKIVAGTIYASKIYANPIKIEEILKMRNELDALTSKVIQLEVAISSLTSTVSHNN